MDLSIDWSWLGSHVGAMYERFYRPDTWEEWIQHAPPQGVRLVNLSATYWITDQWGVHAIGAEGHLYQKRYQVNH